MKLHKWSISTRNKLSSIAGEFDSAAAIEGACMTLGEREKCQKLIRKVVDFIDKENNKARKLEEKMKKYGRR